jgi:hypothetical protein
MLKKIALSIICLIFFALLFIDIESYISGRIVDALWPIGHVTVFAFWSFLLLEYQPSMKAASVKKQFLLLTLFCLTFGVFIEVVQPYFGRSEEAGDVYMDYVGVLLAIVVANRHRLHWFFKVSYFVLLTYLLIPTAMTVFDEAKVRYEFPIIASFDQEIALTRWQADQPLTLTTPQQLPDANKMMRVTFVKRKYSGVALRHFEGDWTGYEQLIVRFYNPNPNTLPVTLIMTDKHYNDGEKTSKNRFDKKLDIKPGLNEMAFPLAMIKAGVELREMDLSQMAGVDFYMYKLTEPVHLYIDRLYLK